LTKQCFFYFNCCKLRCFECFSFSILASSCSCLLTVICLPILTAVHFFILIIKQSVLWLFYAFEVGLSNGLSLGQFYSFEHWQLNSSVFRQSTTVVQFSISTVVEFCILTKIFFLLSPILKTKQFLFQMKILIHLSWGLCYNFFTSVTY